MKKLLCIFLFVPLALFGQDNYSLSFDGQDDNVIIQPSNILDASITNELTLSSWINISDTNQLLPVLRYYPDGLYNPNNNAPNMQFSMNVAFGKIYFVAGAGNININQFEQGVANQGSSSLTINHWHYITITYDQQSIKFFIDGVIDYDRSISAYFDNNNGGNLIFGGDINEWNFNGEIANIEIWNTSLTQEQIKSYMTCPPTGNEEGLVGYWNFNEGSGDTVYDLSGNGNHGIIHGATYSEDVPEESCVVEDDSKLTHINGFTYGGFFDDSYYFISNYKDTWINADSICKSHFGHLVTIQNSSQNLFVSNLIPSEVEDAWIGLTNYSSGNYVWIDDSNLTYKNWANEEPGGYDSHGNPENFGLIHSSASWNDGYGNTSHYFILEIEAINGCLDSEYYNYNDLANTDDGSCMTYEEFTIDSLQEALTVLEVEASTSLSSMQLALDSWNTTIDLDKGWNMFGYGCPEPMDLVQALSDHTDKVIIAKNNEGKVYMPEFGFNGIGDLSPGLGYQIKVTEAIEGFSLCDWYVNDIPEDNIVSLQEELAFAKAELDSLYGCMDEGACNFDPTAVLDDSSCDYETCLDDCGVINGDNTTCLDCSGVPNGTAEDLGCGCGNPAAQEGYDCEGNEIISYQVGDFAQGGIVFYVDETGHHGLVAAMEDLTDGATDPWGWGFNGYEWGCYGERVDGANGQAIGTGYQNTLDVVNQGCTTENGGITAAQAALDAEINGYSDWHLPSRDELKEMYNTIGNGGPESNIGGFVSDWYWSSSEDNTSSAWSVSFDNGGTTNFYKFYTFRVRVIRAF